MRKLYANHVVLIKYTWFCVLQFGRRVKDPLLSSSSKSGRFQREKWKVGMCSNHHLAQSYWNSVLIKQNKTFASFILLLHYSSKARHFFHVLCRYVFFRLESLVSTDELSCSDVSCIRASMSCAAKSLMFALLNLSGVCRCTSNQAPMPSLRSRR